ncbi:MAG: DUF1292 domain-containing protein [Candidatus Gastranaerophilales bacterium]|nr:DUF1292 domain-containing protein [Candidatus Gastranaerophilales bacterium]
MSELENEQMEPRIIKTQDENGEIHNFELIDIINIDDQDYGLLVYLDTEGKKPEDEDEEEVVIMRLSKQDDAFTFETIEDDEEFDKVVSYLETDEEEGEEE